MNKLSVQPVILCGGAGTRLWPLSRRGFPKQFLVLTGTSSLFQQAITRINALADDDIDIANALIVTNEEHRFLVLDQLRDIGQTQASVILEPVSRNTAPALTLAALEAVDEGRDPVLVVTPSDQTIGNEAAFVEALRTSVRAAADGAMVILGIVPDRPETGYGYIRADQGKVRSFIEKPPLETAIEYVEKGGYCWNSGIFVMRASVWLEALSKYRPDIRELACMAWSGKLVDDLFIRPDKELFQRMPSESIDYAVIEKCPGSAFSIDMVELNAGWNDLGSWDAVWQVSERDDCGNSVQGDVLLNHSYNNLIRTSSRLVGVVGVSDLVVIETPDAVLVAHRKSSQDVKKIVEELSQVQREESFSHRKVHRPWGWYDSTDSGIGFKVKRIQVNPGASLSLQKHSHRAEHWVVVRGTAKITNGIEQLVLTENQSTYIPLGVPHRLENPGNEPLEIIEVQSGEYLGEDDIVRFDDAYGRAS